MLQNFHHVCGPGFIYERVSAHQAEGFVHKLQWTMERYRHRFEKFYFNLQDKFSSIFVTNLNNIYLPSFFKGQVRCLNFNSCKGSRSLSYSRQFLFFNLSFIGNANFNLFVSFLRVYCTGFQVQGKFGN